MESYNLSARAQFDVVGIYKYGIKYFGTEQAVVYLTELEDFLEELIFILVFKKAIRLC